MKLSMKQRLQVAVSKNYSWVEENGQYFLIDSKTGNHCDPKNIDTKISIYKDRVDGWFLEIADKLRKDNEAGFVILQVAVSYIEGNQQFRDGKMSKNASRKFFDKAMRRIFDKNTVPESVISLIYCQVRCGLFHDGMTKDKVVISTQFPDPVKVQNMEVFINPHKFLDKIKADLDSYIDDLKSPENVKLRDNFEKMMFFGNVS